MLHFTSAFNGKLHQIQPQNNAKVIGRRHEVPKGIYALKEHKKNSLLITQKIVLY
jgi:hypothetical protein